VEKDKAAAEQPSSASPSLDLETVVRRLYDSALRVGIQASDAGMQVWISDRLHRVREERVFSEAGEHREWREDSAALWLHTAALRLFPDEAYARRFRQAVIEEGDAQAMKRAEAVPMAEQPVASAAEQGPASAQPQLLIVEDEVMVAWGLGEIARELGWKVCALVTTQEAAVEVASHLRPHAILMDYRLGDGGDGLAAARRIREATDIPIIFCSAYARWLNLQILSLPRAKLIAKPVRASSLREALAWALAKQSRQ
jgi:CheY-like chemotaxis protein